MQMFQELSWLPVAATSSSCLHIYTHLLLYGLNDSRRKVMWQLKALFFEQPSQFLYAPKYPFEGVLWHHDIVEGELSKEQQGSTIKP